MNGLQAGNIKINDKRPVSAEDRVFVVNLAEAHVSLRFRFDLLLDRSWGNPARTDFVSRPIAATLPRVATQMEYRSTDPKLLPSC